MKIEVEKMKMKKNMMEEDKEKNLVMVVHRYIQWTCNLMAEIISKLLGIKKLTERLIWLTEI
jgi:hypothetical protein